jgi:flavin reductase (DIM6/NTAB) family NADH-FMN oxidoreductase RutF
MKQQKAVFADAGWIEKNIRDFPGAPAARIGDEWALLSAAKEGVDGEWNTMTISWGGLGVLWGKDVAFVFVRPGRQTREFMDAASLFTLSFFDRSCHKALEICGAQSGRDIDKAAETGLTAVVFNSGLIAGALAFKEATEVIVCRKIYTHDIDPAAFLDKAIESCYPEKDYHRMYVGEVLGLRVRASSKEAP